MDTMHTLLTECYGLCIMQMNDTKNISDMLFMSSILYQYSNQAQLIVAMTHIYP